MLFHFRRKQLHLRLRLKLGLGGFTEITAVKPFAHVVAGDLRVFLLQQLVASRID